MERGAHPEGGPVRREDPPLLTGDARYTDDYDAGEYSDQHGAGGYADGGLLHAAVRRSQYGSAEILDVDTDAAEAVDGVVAVFTGADVAASDAGGTVVTGGSFPGQLTTEFSMLPAERVRFTGEAVAVVAAEDRYAAHEAADLVDVSYDRREAVTDVEEALGDDAPLVHESLGTNRLFDHEFGDEAATDEAFRHADHTVALEVANPRLVPVPLEPRSALGDYDAETGELTVHVSTQSPHRTRDGIAAMLGLSADRVRVVAPDVGGGFGSKGPAPKAGEPLAAWCAMQVGRPVKWVETRTGNMKAGPHGRGNRVEAELAFDDDGKIRGLRLEALANAGAYLNWGHLGMAHVERLSSGAYDIEAISGRTVGVLTNTAPVGPYRGAGRPEANYVVERLVDRAAAEVGLDPAEFRRRNFFRPEAFPVETAVGTVYDSGDYERALDVALGAADYERARIRQAELREEGRYLGVGLCSFVENSGTPGMGETARVELDEGGSVTAYSGASSHGQGHATVFAHLVADALGVDANDVEYRDGDTADLESGVGTFASRSAPQAGGALIEATREVREALWEAAADRLETALDDVEFDDGTFRVVGAPERSMDVRDVAGLVHSSTDTPVGPEGLTATTSSDIEGFAVTFGTHVAVVEVDPDSGEVDVERYVAVDDCGVQFHPRIVEGQVHGGIAQGVGEAMYGDAVYDDNGSLVTGSLQDYAVPRAMDVPELETESTVTPSSVTRSGAKGTGESGTIAAPPALVNAVVDALAPLGVSHVEKPLDEETVWRAVREATEDG